MIRNIVKIDEDKCIGCGLCTSACQEGALQLVDGKARLMSDTYCDGLGKCLPNCPVDAITIEQREAAAFNREEAPKHRASQPEASKACGAGGCPGTRGGVIARPAAVSAAAPADSAALSAQPSQLGQWPCQIKLVAPTAPFFDNAHLLIAADCTAYAYASIHQDFMKGKITLIGCPKLDEVNYAEKLTEIFKAHPLKSITVLRMEKPCCGGIVNAVKQAIAASGNIVPWQVVIIATDGTIISQ